MHIDTGDSPPICQKPYTLPLKHYSWVQQEIKTLECAGVIRKSISPWASSIVMVPKKSAPGEPPRHRMCMDFRKINELQPKTQKLDKQTNTQGNLSWISLPKIDEMYANLHGTNNFTHEVVITKLLWTRIPRLNCICDTVWWVWIQCSSFWFSTSTCIFSTTYFNGFAGL